MFQLRDLVGQIFYNYIILIVLAPLIHASSSSHFPVYALNTLALFEILIRVLRLSQPMRNRSELFDQSEFDPFVYVLLDRPVFSCFVRTNQLVWQQQQLQTCQTDAIFLSLSRDHLLRQPRQSPRRTRSNRSNDSSATRFSRSAAVAAGVIYLVLFIRTRVVASR